ncbi:hypothetical protein SEA_REDWATTLEHOG_37 [Gordonia phage RedWattleHog]|uniref:Uncharacterized protein n=1 Tax=Gordonia phage Stormageddon TaxID=2656541 RepID=A0A649VQX4_9CAUD|nr:minor tail protein [Gordonia phage Stormageddon]QGJ94897.1 hypothetical protein SEA_STORMAGEDDON_34 [Gordonia phage Stormageddon]QLF83541.1 hypothetical protein SEA_REDWATTLEHOG_37 [Gordonia phage RedWattleHog]
MAAASFDPEKDVNKPIEGSPGGPVEAVKRGVIQAFRVALNGSTFNDDSSPVYVEMEYPLEKVHYPGVWVQFSLTSLSPAGHGHLFRDPDSGDLLQEMVYQGRVTLTLVALSSRERDRLADLIINTLSFSRVSSPNVITENGYQETFSPLYDEFNKNPHVSISINSDRPNPMGQAVNVGTPWDPDTLVYEDAYSFEVLGQFMLVTSNEGLYRLKRVDINYDFAPRPPAGDDGEGAWI